MSVPLSLLLFSFACSGESEDTAAAQADSGTDTDDGYFLDDGACADVPVVTWSTFGQGFVDFYCQGCHASTTQNRHDAPESVVFDLLGLDRQQLDTVQCKPRAQQKSAECHATHGITPVGRRLQVSRACGNIWPYYL